MTPTEFKAIRMGLLLTQQELAALLGYAHKIRISEFERPRNRQPIPPHIEDAMLRLKATGGRLPKSQIGRLTREWNRAA